MSSRMRLVGRTLLALTAVLTVASCSDSAGSPVAPRTEAPPAPLMSTTTSFSGSGGYYQPNGVPYRNPTYKLDTGRSGEATFSVRALMNKDGSTDLQTSTGDFDGTAPPFDLSKVQVKYLAQTGDGVVWTRNYPHLSSGRFDTSYQGLERHRMMRVQGNVIVPNASGKGKTRTGVVTLRTRVNLRPDLAALGISAPSKAYVNTDVDFTATVAELNGDLGATADCVYYINGQAAATTNIWVGAGDKVTCQLDHTFTAVGTYNVKVSLENVNPGDYDLSNNQASTTIQIVPRVLELHGNAEAEVRIDRVVRGGILQYSDTSNTASFYGTAPEALTFPTSLSVRQTSNGTRSDVELSSFGTQGSACEKHQDADTQINVCSDAAAKSTTVNVSYASGVSARYESTSRRKGGGGGYHWVVNTWGTDYHPLGGIYVFYVKLVDGAGVTFEASPVGFFVRDSHSHTILFPRGYSVRYWRTGTTTF